MSERPSTVSSPDTSDETVDDPTDLDRSSLLAVLKRARVEFRNDHVPDLAAGLTYYGILSVVPALIVLVGLLGLLGQDATEQVLDQVRQLAPGSSAEAVQTLIAQAQANRTGAGIGAVVGLAVAIWSASGYVAAFIRASNIVYDIGEGRPIWRILPIRVGLTIAALVTMVVSAVIVVVSGPVAQQIGDLIGAGDTAVLVWSILKWPVLIIMVSALLALLFWASPNAKQPGIKWVTPGGLIAVLLVLMVSALFSLYVVNFSSYDKTYGSMAGLVIFLVWLWLVNIAILLGLEVNAELERGRAIATEGLPADVEPFVEPRDTRKLDEEEKREVEEAKAQRTHAERT